MSASSRESKAAHIKTYVSHLTLDRNKPRKQSYELTPYLLFYVAKVSDRPEQLPVSVGVWGKEEV